MSLQGYLRQVKPRLTESYVPHVDKVQNFISEAYNIPIQKNSDIDDFETKLDKSQLKSLLKHLSSLNLDDIPIVGGRKYTKYKNLFWPRFYW